MNDADPFEILRELRRTRQFREFTPQPPTEAEVAALTEVARWTGSSRNTQPWRFIVIRDRDVIGRIHDAGVPQTRALRTAPVAIAIVLSGDPGDVEHAFDEGRVSERLLIGAQSLGLGAGIAWAKAEVRPVIGEILGLPADHFVRTLVVVGHPSEAAIQPKSAPGRARRPASEMVFVERWPQD